MPNSVRKATQVLGLFTVERPDWGPTDVAAELGMAKSSAHALLAELTRAGLTERLPSGRYRLGWRTVALARTKLATSRLRSAAVPLTRQLAAHFGETVHVAAREGDGVLYVASERPPGGVPRPAASPPGPGSPLGRVLSGDEPAGGYLVADQPALEGVTCAVAPVRSGEAAIALCASKDRFAGRDAEYGRAVAGVAKHVGRSVRE